MNIDDKLKANSFIVLREESDNWALLFNPDTAEVYGLNPVSVFIWKRLDGKHTIRTILNELSLQCINIPKNAQNEIEDFINNLLKINFVAVVENG
jgi:SynChlorMet cassette protein ScmD